MISIIVPVYNVEHVLERCIKSILTQTYTDIELLLINDGSSDNSEFICKKYAEIDSRVHFYTKDNGGAASARNFGIEVSKGEYIQFVDSDDWIEKNMVESMYHALVDYKVDWVICGMKYISLKKTSFNLFGNYCCRLMDEMCKVIMEYYTKGILHSSCNKLYKKSFITNNMKENYVYGEDYIFNLNYLKNISSFVTINDALYIYDCRNESITRGRAKNKEEIIKEQFDISYKVLNSLFNSEKLNSVIVKYFLNELIMNFVYTHSVFRINKSLLMDTFKDYIKYIKIIQNNTNKIHDAISKEIYGKVVWYLKVLRVKFVIKEMCKRTLGRLRNGRKFIH